MDGYDVLDFLSRDQVDRLRQMGVLNETRLRDERIRRDYKRLRLKGLPPGVAIRSLMGKFCRSAKTIERVVYSENFKKSSTQTVFSA